MNAPAKVMVFTKPRAPELPSLPEPVYANASDWRRERPKLTRCANCGGLRLLATLNPHAPHYTEVAGVVTLVDCIGTVLR